MKKSKLIHFAAAVLAAVLLAGGAGLNHYPASAAEPLEESQPEAISLEDKEFFLDNKITDAAIKNKTTVFITATLSFQYGPVVYESEWNFADLEKESVSLPSNIDLTSVNIEILHHSSDSYAGTTVFQYNMEASGKTEQELNGFTITARKEQDNLLHYVISVKKEVLAEKYVGTDKLIPPIPSSSLPAELIPEEGQIAVPATRDQEQAASAETQTGAAASQKTTTQQSASGTDASAKTAEEKKNSEQVDVKQAALPSVGSSSNETVSKKTGVNVNTAASKSLSPANLLMIGAFVVASLISVFVLFKDELLKQKKGTRT
ncbi:MAG: hypothetical protein HUJ54_12275 [Erysipelotrichaceae bacterium]|nr:hypothetical protein [Erysipelotrichaceae bacterium]